MNEEKPDELTAEMRSAIWMEERFGSGAQEDIEALVRSAIAEKDTQLAALTRDNERLSNLLKTTRDMNVVEVTADRDSWMEQARMAQDQVERFEKLDETSLLRERAVFVSGLRRAVEILDEQFAARTVSVVDAIGAIEREIAG